MNGEGNNVGYATSIGKGTGAETPKKKQKEGARRVRRDGKVLATRRGCWGKLAEIR